ncbi:hypothetical protein [Azospirillum rugosum]|uniref:Uncharacterized protein n=1 Tax=Azospirillum rugosum TaxID=416170 RepID=A0ABS4SHH3_9PROT|nr:hypothetical protein [Azospirillum rugosum]MBP2291488.1 hypothetical protein [Azospirillum rugosum]MDQ0525276.1 hypothetical protein [Azospirillum rugosum]
MTSSFTSSELLRFESLGDNCEFGFVLRRHACEAGSLFRWAAMKPDQLLSLLRANFTDFYRFENLAPLRTNMVLDAPYGIGWHTDLKSEVASGRLHYRDDEATRRKLHRKEVRKLQYLLSKFAARLRLGGVIYVLKSNGGIAPDTVDGILDELTALAGHTDFALLEVQASDDPARIGTVERRGPQRLRGYVSRFAAYQKADDVDAEAWTRIMDGARHLYPCPDWSRRLADLHVESVDGGIQLAFPIDASQDLNKPIMGDLRAGMARLLNGNQWCRVFGDNFRLHGPNPDRPGNALRWTGVYPPGPFQLSATARCPVSDSVPLRLSVHIHKDDGTLVAEEELQAQPGRAGEIALLCPVGGQPLTITITVNAARALQTGERAVVDLTPPGLHPDLPAPKLDLMAARAVAA